MKSLVVFALLTGTAAFAANPPAANLTGWISDSMCKADHAGKEKKDVACVKKCIKGGAHPVFVDDASSKVWMIDNPDAIASLQGEHVDVSATTDAAASSIHISKAKALGD